MARSAVAMLFSGMGCDLFRDGGDKDLAADSSGQQLIERLGRVVEGQDPIDSGFDDAVIDESGNGAQRLTIGD